MSKRAMKLLHCSVQMEILFLKINTSIVERWTEHFTSVLNRPLTMLSTDSHLKKTDGVIFLNKFCLAWLSELNDVNYRA